MLGGQRRTKRIAEGLGRPERIEIATQAVERSDKNSSNRNESSAHEHRYIFLARFILIISRLRRTFSVHPYFEIVGEDDKWDTMQFEREKINGRVAWIREFAARKSSILIFVLGALNWKFVQIARCYQMLAHLDTRILQSAIDLYSK